MGGPPRVGYNPNSGEGFTGISPRIEVLGLHYEVMPGDLKVSYVGRMEWRKADK